MSIVEVVDTVEAHGGYEVVHEQCPPKPDGQKWVVERGARFYALCALCSDNGKPGRTVASGESHDEAEQKGVAHVHQAHPGVLF